MRALEKLSGGPLTFGKALRAIRECEEASLADFATRLGTSRQNLCAVEQGRRRVSIERAAAWARILEESETQFIRLALQDQVADAGLDIEVTVRSHARSGRRSPRREAGATRTGAAARRRK